MTWGASHASFGDRGSRCARPGGSPYCEWRFEHAEDIWPAWQGYQKTDVKRGAAKLRARNPAAHIMAAPKGARTVSHRRIEEAVDKVFRERSLTHA